MAFKAVRVQPADLPAMGLGSGSGPTSPFGAAKAPIGTSIIGTDLTILGRDIVIVSQNRVHIDGDIRGDVAGREVTVGEDGSVVGIVSGEKVEVHGGVKGAIRAARVVLHPSAEIDAEILHRSLSIADGAQVEGYLRKAKSETELMPNLDPNSYSSKPSE